MHSSDPKEKPPPEAVRAGTGPSAARKCPILDFYVSIHSLATPAARKAGSLSTNTAQSVDRLSTNKADHETMSKTEIDYQTLSP